MNGTAAANALIEGAERVIRGKRDFLELLAAALFAGGHVLLEDLPGLGKTTVAKTIARLAGGGPAPRAETDAGAPGLPAAPEPGFGGGEAGGARAPGETVRSLSFRRIQFTPDLLPYDITGVDIFDPESRAFRFMPGPVLANIVLADEINRATPRVQSALLEVMAERQVTIGTATHRPPEPFFVIATENPVESDGTWPLPAAQLDRFMMRLSLGYPTREAELSILEEEPGEKILNALPPVISVAEFLAARDAVREIWVHPALREAIADTARGTRSHRGITLGASPRAALQLLAGCRARAMIRGRDYVIDEDLIALASPVLAHRIKTRDPHARAELIVREICLEHCAGIRTG